VSNAVLFVDDEQNVLDAVRRALRNRAEIHTANSGADGLRAFDEHGPFALVVSDMRMPLMNGAQFLAKVRERAPDTIRMILTGQADLQSTIAAVNEGHIFRFLCKPCPPEQLGAAIDEGLRQHRLVTAEKVLLEQTLGGAIKLLIEILGMVRPAAFSRTARLQRYVGDLAADLGLRPAWQWGVAAMTSQLGFLALPEEVLAKVEAAQSLREDERRLYESHPEIARKLLTGIPRLEEVAVIVASQLTPVCITGEAEDPSRWDTRTAGQLLLRAAVEFDRLAASGLDRSITSQRLESKQLGFPLVLCKALRTLGLAKQDYVARELRLRDLAAGMILDQALLSPKGTLLVPAGQEITRALIIKLSSIAESGGVAEPFRVRVPS